MSRGLGRIQQAVLADLKRRQAAGEHPLTTRHVPEFRRQAVSRAYIGLAERGLIELLHAQICRPGRGRLVVVRC